MGIMNRDQQLSAEKNRNKLKKLLGVKKIGEKLTVGDESSLVVLSMPEGGVCTEAGANLGRNFSGSPSAIVEYSGLRGLPIGSGDRPGPLSRPAPLLARTWNSWASASAEAVCALEAQVRRGSVLYLGGDIPPTGHFSMAPFLSSLVEAIPAEQKTYQFTEAAQVPFALRNECADTELPLMMARNLDKRTIPLAVAGTSDRQLPFIFGISHGAGFVVCDLSGSKPSGSDRLPLLSRLADPAGRPAEVGSLIAAELAVGRDLGHPGFYDLVLDDRPINHDHFATGRLTRWLSHMKDLEPDFHLDCAWIPDQTSPPERYVETLKRFGVGFVWHGLLSHIDHGTLPRPQDHLERGQECMRQISDRFRVSIQPVMVFPMERRSEEALRCLRDAGFAALAEFGERNPADEDRLLPYLRYSTPLRYAGAIRFPALRRRAVRSINRQLMLALTILGVPIIATLHPGDVGIRRMPWRRAECPQLVDSVLNFAREKNLKSRSLIELVNDMETWPLPLAANSL